MLACRHFSSVSLLALAFSYNCADCSLHSANFQSFTYFIVQHISIVLLLSRTYIQFLQFFMGKIPDVKKHEDKKLH